MRRCGASSNDDSAGLYQIILRIRKQGSFFPAGLKFAGKEASLLRFYKYIFLC